MDRIGLWSLLLVALLYLCFGTSLVSGKCVGRWAIHACGGGNGKRAEQKLTPDTDRSAERNKALLERLLLRHKVVNEDVPRYTMSNQAYGDSDEAKSSESQTYSTRSDRDSRKLWRKLLAVLKAKYKMTS